MTDDLETVVHRLRTGHNSALVVVHDEQTEHIGYWDKSKRYVEVGALEYAQEQGFRVIHAGTTRCNETGQRQAWVEVRRKNPCEVYGDA